MRPRKVLIAGATGLVGQELLKNLLADRSVKQVHSLGRRKPSLLHAKLTSHIVDFAALPSLPRCDEVYLALGTTIKVAGSQEKFRALDHDANLAVAKAAMGAGARRAGLVSAMGASASSRVFYSRVKGELEDALGQLGFDGLVIARPSLLVGDRESLGQPARAGERLGVALSKAIGMLIPGNYKPIDAAKVAASLLAQVPKAAGTRVLMSGEMQRAVARP